MPIVKQKSTYELVDLLGGCDRWEIKLSEHGFVALVDMMPRLVPVGQTAEYAIKRAARTSTGNPPIRSTAEDTGLLRYLYRHKHSTPIEFVTLTFHMVLPIFVARQMVRHRMASINEASLRYSEAKDRFWFPQPEDLRKQGTANKQGGDEPMDLRAASDFIDRLALGNSNAMEDYQYFLGKGMSREIARIGMPVNLMTEWYWTTDLHNCLHFLGLRQDKHAQKEIRDYADAMYELIKPVAPVIVKAYDDYHTSRGGLALTAIDIELINGTTLPHDVINTRELEEAADKLERLGQFPVVFRIRDEVQIRREAKEKADAASKTA